MTSNFLEHLGLDQVESDPNAIPDGTYDGVVFESDYRLSKEKDSISHLITFQVDSGDQKGAQLQKWTKLGDEPRDAQGNFPDSAEQVATFSNTMTEKNKQWFKKLFVDLGVPEQEVAKTHPKQLVGRPCTFGVKLNNGYRNVNFQRLREDAVTSQAPTTQQVSITDPDSATTQSPW